MVLSRKSCVVKEMVYRNIRQSHVQSFPWENRPEKKKPIHAGGPKIVHRKRIISSEVMRTVILLSSSRIFRGLFDRQALHDALMCWERRLGRLQCCDLVSFIV